MSATEHKIVIDGTEYKWVHNNCFCLGHCGTDEFFVNGEPMGRFDNSELCSLITELMRLAGDPVEGRQNVKPEERGNG